MLVCPVCNYNHQEEVSKCQRCNLSIKDDDDLNSIEINSENPILKTCIPTLVKHLENETESKNKLLLHIQTLDPDIQKANNKKLDEIIDAIGDCNKQYLQEIKTLEEQVIELKSLIESKNNFSNVTTETKNSSATTENIQTSLSIETSVDINSEKIGNMEDSEKNNVFPTESDRNLNNDSNPTNEPQEDSLYNETGDRNENNLVNMDNNDLGNNFDITGDRPSSETDGTQENIAPEVNSNRNYQSFYRLINNGELEVTKVTVPQETMEKIRGGTLSEFKFINDRKGNYWIVNWHNVYCLIPKEKTYINQHQYGNFQRVFECQNYQETYSDFEIIEPATVFNSNDGTWQLERKGKIKFV
jgi:TolA-binding protein